MDLDERSARIGLACAASRDASLSSPAAQPPATDLWEQVTATYPTIDPAGVEAAAAGAGWRIVTPGDREWPATPHGTSDGGDTPWALWVYGDADLWKLTCRSVAVLGTRNPSSYGAQVSALLGRELSTAGWSVVAACALGCDEQALTAAYRMDTPPIGVYAAGRDLRAFQARGHALGMHGLLVSDVPPDAPSRRDRFLARHDLLAFLTAGVVVVETTWRGLALVSVAAARHRGRPVMAVPGPVTDSRSAVGHHLIRNHAAVLVESAEQITATLVHAARTPTTGDPR
ncbi:DNA-processing protein DprA [Frankia sp. ACN1ag]|uniref:DNA-processing protein DprA n=1 Tax=Frankia sp. ACN1ag TaxID=102891 RepID=UPI0006DD0508|nr:DNA-processing protein DprA [Frankia sp. ACN1ag]